jgi:hypothetical protein
MKPHSPERKQKMSEAARRSLERREQDPTELEIWGCDPCPEYPNGLVGRAFVCRDPQRRVNQNRVKDGELRMLPHGRGKLLGSE